jgi:2,3-dihydroxybenzoate-AMP ligase
VRGCVATSGAPKLEAILGAPAYHVFGMTEGVIMLAHASDSKTARHETVGRPISPHDRVRILKPGTDQELPHGEVGEPAFDGPYTIHGYYNAADRDAETFTQDGAYRSGDLMSVRNIDGKDYFVFQGRIKDVVDRAGEKINAEEVEWAVVTHPAVAACGVIGVKDRVYGERVCACVVVKPGSAAPGVADMGRYLEAFGLAKFKWPERIEVLTELPVTHVGKLDKIALRTRFSSPEVAP